MSSFFNILFTSRKIDRLLKTQKMAIYRLQPEPRVLFAAGRLKKLCALFDEEEKIYGIISLLLYCLDNFLDIV